MSATESTRDIAETAARFRRLYTAAVYDVMDEMELPNQCLDLGIKPLDAGMQIAGPAFTVMAGPDPRTRDEIPSNPRLDRFAIFDHMYEGCVVVVACAGERQSGIWGELMSNASRAKGAVGIVIDGGIRDGRLLFDIEGWSTFARYTSPIESLGRSRIHDLEVPVALGGSLTSQVRVEPGDWVFGDMDGVLVIPSGVLDEVLARAEEGTAIEEKTRAEIRGGRSVWDVYQQYGRL
jgi:4-hydroxy-4-methyl-2-oxoglutarate aldolase